MHNDFDVQPVQAIKDNTITTDNPTGDIEYYMVTKSQLAILIEKYNYPEYPLTESQILEVIQKNI